MLSEKVKLHGRHNHVSLDKNMNVKKVKCLPALHKRLELISHLLIKSLTCKMCYLCCAGVAY